MVRITEILCLVSVIRLTRSRPDREAVRAKTWTREPVDACVRVPVEPNLDLISNSLGCGSDDAGQRSHSSG